MPKIMKKRVGIFSFTCDEGCSIYLIEIFNKKLLEWLQKMELIYFLSLKDYKEFENLDIAIVEGSISTERDKREIEFIRKKAEVLIGMGSCTITGLPSCQRNFFNVDQLKQIESDMMRFKFLPKCLAVKEVVKLDAEVAGCPMEEGKFIEVFEKYL
jgi:sulfhydrogenase subunit delta